MKTYQTDHIKNIVLLGNSGSGKTTLAEAMLLEGGVISRKGDVDSRNTVSDFREIEQENERSIYSTLMYTEFGDHKINILDAPGADDFIGGVVSSLRVADTALMVINAQNGVEVGTDIHSRYLSDSKTPVIFVVNQCDHDKANYEKSVEMLKERFGSQIAITQYPVNSGPSFDSIIDLLTMKCYKFSKDGKAEITDIPADEADKAAELHNELVEKAAENDEALMELFFEKDTLDESEIRKGIIEGLKKAELSPVFCTSAKTNAGVTRLLEFIVNVVPGPVQMHAEKTTDDKEITCDASGPASIFVFKTEYESHIGEINYFKVTSGEIAESNDLTNNNTRTKERLSQLFVVAGKTRNKVPKLSAGDLGATVKLKNTKTNHTLTIGSESFELVQTQFPEPKYRTAVKPLNEGDEEKLGEALSRVQEEDPTVNVEYSKELKQIILGGQGEHHLNIVKWHLENTFGLEIEFIPPRIPYRETITKVAQADYRHKKQSGGAGQFGEVHMIIEPYVEGAADPNMFKINGKDIKVSIRNKDEIDLQWGGKLVFYNCIVGGSIDARFLPAILKGIMEKMEEGPLTGSYARDIKVYVYDGKMHPVDSNEISFKLAGRNAFREAFRNAGPKIMEPIYDLEVFVPSDRMGDVISDLQGRRAIVQGMSSEKSFEKVSAKVPLAEMNKYSTALSSLTNGRAMYSMKYAEYAQVPPDVQEQLLKAYDEQQDEE